MIKILLVEDEPLMRDAVLSLLDWEQSGFSIVAQAQNGKEALYYLQKPDVDIDIVLTDIKMPVLDGLELLQKAQDRIQDVAFIMLSSYDEFNLVSSAYKLGAKDYILKSEITEEQVITVLQNATHKLLAERNEKESRTKQAILSSVFTENIQVLRRRRLQEIMEGRYTSQQVRQTSYEAVNIKLTGDKYVVLALSSLDSTNKDNHLNDLVHFQTERTGMIEHILTTYDNAYFIPFSYNQYAVLACYDKMDSFHIKQDINQMYIKIRETCERKLDIRLNGGMSHISRNLESAPTLYTQALLASHQAFISDNGHVIAYSDYADLLHKHNVQIVDHSKKLRSLLNSIDSDAIKKAIPSMKINADMVKPNDISTIIAIFENDYRILLESAESSMIDQELQMVFSTYQDEIRARASLPRLNDWLEWALSSYAAAVDGGNAIINRAKQMIHDHYADHLTLTEIAQSVGVNSSYLSRLFNKTVGCTYIDYLSRVRMDAALVLFRSTNLKVYEVAEKVGYANPEHFSRVFKKYLHMSPKQFLS